MSPLRKATIIDVAGVANVSIQTVSAVVNRKPGISDPTRDRVLLAIERLQYRPNGIASSLRAQKSHTVGVLIPTITNPFFPEFVRGAEDAASEKGYSIFLCNSDEDTEKEIQYLRLLQRHRVAGILVSYVSGPADSEPLLTELASHHVPIAILGSAQTGQGIVSLRVNESEITSVAASHLLGLGHRRIGFITPPPSKNIAQMRIEGFKRAFLDADLPIRPEYLIDGASNSRTVFEGLNNCFLCVTLRPRSSRRMTWSRLGLSRPSKDTGAVFRPISQWSVSTISKWPPFLIRR